MTFLHRFLLIVLFVLSTTSSGIAQFVSSGTGSGVRSGSAGLMGFDAAAQSLGFANAEAMEAAAEQGYGETAEDGAAWTAASSGTFDMDCQVEFGQDCDEVDASVFKPLLPIIEQAIEEGYINITEKETYENAVTSAGGSTDDAANCKAKGYSAEMDSAQLCVTATMDDEREDQCRARVNAPEGSDIDCSDLTEDEYTDVVTNSPPVIALPSGWTPPSLLTSSTAGTSIVALTATDPDNDPLTWSLTAGDGTFSVSGSGQVSLAQALGDMANSQISVTVQVSDGIATDSESFAFSVGLSNRPPRIQVPMDWIPGDIAGDAEPGDSIITVLGATDPDGDTLTWSVSAASPNIFDINPNTGRVTLTTDESRIPADRPTSVSVTVRVSDGTLYDEESFQLALAAIPNRPPRIQVPMDWMPGDIAYDAQGGDPLITALGATDPDGDELTWSVSDASPNIFDIDATTGRVTLTTDDSRIPADRPESVTVTIRVSDGTLYDEESFKLALADPPNRPPEIIDPELADGIKVAFTPEAGAELVSLSANDPDGDELSWSLAAADIDIFAIDQATGAVTLGNPTALTDMAERPQSVSFTVQVSDGTLTDTQELAIVLNSAPRIQVPMDWVPGEVAYNAQSGDSLISALGATDADGDTLTWSFAASDLDIFAIDSATGVVTLNVENGVAGIEKRPNTVSFTVQVSDGELSDTQDLTIAFGNPPNRAPEIIVPEGFAEKQFAPYGSPGTSVGALQGRDPDGDKLTWSLVQADPSIFAINADSGALTYNPLGANDQLSCVAGGGSAKATSGSSAGGASGTGLVSVSANVDQGQGYSDFRSKKQGGSLTDSGKYNVVLERSGHQGGTFTTEARSATNYEVNDAGKKISVPALNAATVNSNITPVNSYVVFQNNTREDFRNDEAVITFENPILGLYFTDGGFDRTIGALGKPGAQYSRASQQSKLGLENGKDIAWIDPVDRRKLRYRSRTAGIGDFLRVLTTASDGGGSTGGGSSDAPDECSASVTVQLTDGELTDEETLKLAFGDPNRAPKIISPAGWVEPMIAAASSAGDMLVSVLAARDPDGDAVRWSLEGSNADWFNINERDGIISLSDALASAATRPNRATVIVRVSDGRLADTRELTFDIEEVKYAIADPSFGLSGRAAFVGGGPPETGGRAAPIAAPFNGTYTIFTRFYKGDQGVSEYQYRWKRTKKGTRYVGEKIHVPQTIFSHNDADVLDPNDSGDATHLYIRNGKLAIKIGSHNYNHNITATNRPVGRGWHTAMIVVDREGVHQKAGCGGSGWPVKKFYLDGNLLPLSKPHINKQQTFLPGCRFKGQIRANRYMTLGIGDGFKGASGDYDSHRERPLHPSHGVHEVTIWAGDMSQHKNKIMTAGQGANYPEVGVPMPVYWWKPGLIGEAETANGEVTMTVPNLANGAGPKGRPLAGNGWTREAGDMHLYAGRFNFNKISGNDWQASRDQSLNQPRHYKYATIIGFWHQGKQPGLGGINGYFDVNALPQFERQDSDDDEAYRDRIRNEIRKFGLRDLN